MYRSTPSCQATSVVAFSSRIARLGAIRPPQAAAGSACVRKTARVAAAAGTSLLTIWNLLFRRKRHYSDADGLGKFPLRNWRRPPGRSLAAHDLRITWLGSRPHLWPAPV